MNPRSPWLCIFIVALLGAPVVSIAISGALGHDSPPDLRDLAKVSIGALASFLVIIPRGSVGAKGGNDHAP